MSLRHLAAIIWLRWRLAVNRIKRGGAVQMIAAAAVGLWLAGCGLGMTALAVVGGILLSDVSPDIVMLAWDGIVVAYLLFWVIELMIELQRAEMVSPDKLMHLPASHWTLFLLNYIQSWICFVNLAFVPAMVTLALTLGFSRGPLMFAMLPPLIAFLFMTTALTYQFRGWLAVLVSNPRRRRTIVAVLLGIFILLANLPGLIGLALGRVFQQQGQERWRQAQADQKAQATAQANRIRDAVFGTLRVVNLCLPFGWLPQAAAAAARGNGWPALWGSAGLSLIAAASLRRAYRTTQRLVTQGVDYGPKSKSPARSAVPAIRQVKRSMIERRLPWCSEQTAAVAWSNFRSYTRAPEVKLILLSPMIILPLLLGGLFMGRNSAPSEAWHPLIALGGIWICMLPLAQLMCNQFGFDRAGFRAYVLSATPRSRILLGKNLALAPLALAPAMLGLFALQCFLPMSFLHLLGTVVQTVVVYITFCFVGNVASIIAPAAVAVGSLRPATANVQIVLINLLFCMIMPISTVPSLALMGVETLAGNFALASPVGLYLLGSIVELVGVGWLYHWTLKSAGAWLQRREATILGTVAVNVE